MTTENDMLVAAKQDGIEIGRADGLAEGLEQGLEQGQKESARNFKTLGVDIEIICKATGLSREQVDAL